MRASIGAAATVLAGGLGVAAVGATFAHASVAPPAVIAKHLGTAQTPQGVMPHYSLDLSTYPDSEAVDHLDGNAHRNWVSYGPSSSLVVPAHSLVTITIKQYDGGEEIANPYFAAVHGTVDGTMTVDGKATTQIDPAHVGHTFTIHGHGDPNASMFVSVPLPAVPEDAPALENGYPAPHEVSFSFVTGDAGEYVWNCEYPCGDGTYAKFGGPMSMESYMAGTLSIVPSV